MMTKFHASALLLNDLSDESLGILDREKGVIAEYRATEDTRKFYNDLLPLMETYLEVSGKILQELRDSLKTGEALDTLLDEGEGDRTPDRWRSDMAPKLTPEDLDTHGRLVCDVDIFLIEHKMNLRAGKAVPNDALLRNLETVYKELSPENQKVLLDWLNDRAKQLRTDTEFSEKNAELTLGEKEK